MNPMAVFCQKKTLSKGDFKFSSKRLLISTKVKSGICDIKAIGRTSDLPIYAICLVLMVEGFNVEIDA